MDLYNACDSRAKKGLEELKKYIYNTKDLLLTKSEWNGITTIDVEYFTDNDCILTEFLGCWEFDIKGRYIE
jgi:hypothetical protein